MGWQPFATAAPLSPSVTSLPGRGPGARAGTCRGWGQRQGQTWTRLLRPGPSSPCCHLSLNLSKSLSQLGSRQGWESHLFPLLAVSSAEQGASLPATLAMWVQCRGLLTKCWGAHSRGRYCCVIPSLHLWEGCGRGGALCSVVRLSGAQVDGLDLESGSRHFTHVRAAVRRDSSAQNGWEPPRSPMPLAPVCGHIGSLLRLRLRSCPSAFSGSWVGWGLCQVG